LKTNRILAATLALVLIAGLGSPAFAQTSFTDSTPVLSSNQVFVPLHGNDDQSFTGPFNQGGGGFITAQQTTGQTFTSSVDNLVGVDLFMFEAEGSSNTVTVTIRDGDLFGAILGTTNMVVNVPGTSIGNPQAVHFDFPSITLVPGQTYGIQFEEPGPNTLRVAAADGDPYSGGAAFQNSAEVPDIDFGFVTYFEEEPFVGGEFLPIESTTLLLAGAQSFSWMIPVILSGIGIGLFVVSRKSE